MSFTLQMRWILRIVTSKKGSKLLFVADEIAQLLFILWVTNIDKLVFLTLKDRFNDMWQMISTTDYSLRSRLWVFNNYASQMIHAKLLTEQNTFKVLHTTYIVVLLQQKYSCSLLYWIWHICIMYPFVNKYWVKSFSFFGHWLFNFSRIG